MGYNVHLLDAARSLEVLSMVSRMGSLNLLPPGPDRLRQSVGQAGLLAPRGSCPSSPLQMLNYPQQGFICYPLRSGKVMPPLSEQDCLGQGRAAGFGGLVWGSPKPGGAESCVQLLHSPLLPTV